MGSYVYMHVHENVEVSCAKNTFIYRAKLIQWHWIYSETHPFNTSNRVIETNLYFLYNENMMVLRDSSILIMLKVLTDAHVLERQRNSFNDVKGRETSF